MTDDLVQRLRDLARDIHDDLPREAADELVRLREGIRQHILDEHSHPSTADERLSALLDDDDS